MEFIGWITWDKWIGETSPGPHDEDFLLYQDGTVVLLQDESGLLLEQ